MIIHIFISRVNHPQFKNFNELKETKYNNCKLYQHDYIANLIVVYFLQGNHGSGSNPNEDIKIFKNHRSSDYLYTILLSMHVPTPNSCLDLSSYEASNNNYHQ